MVGENLILTCNHSEMGISENLAHGPQDGASPPFKFVLELYRQLPEFS